MNYIGIDLGGTRIKTGLMKDGKLSDINIQNAESFRGLAAHLHLLDDVIEKMMKDQKISSLDGIAMAFPGIVNTRSKRISSTNKKYDDAPEIDLEHYYNKRWNVPFFIDNDARMAAVGEWKYGAGRHSDDVVMVTFGTGIGTSVIINGTLLRGRHFQAGCLGGHFVVNYKGSLCTCGNVGCVEAEASSWNIETRVRQNENFTGSPLSTMDKIDFAALFKAAQQGDELAVNLRDNCLQVWSAGIINYIHAYDPEVVILGGGVLNSSRDIMPFIHRKVKEHAWTPWGQVDLRLSELKDNAAIYGAAHCLEYEV
jgi:glucokinase